MPRRRAPLTRGRDLLVLRGIGISFGGLRALDGVDLAVPEGGLYGIIGPNGAGKTTLFNVINGFLRARTAARSASPATPIAGLRPNQVCRRGIGRTFQVVRAFPRMTVLENVIVGAFVGAARRRGGANGWRSRRSTGSGSATARRSARRRPDDAGAAADGAGARAGAAARG